MDYMDYMAYYFLCQDLHALDVTSETMTLTERGEPQYNTHPQYMQQYEREKMT